jgi:hypothetical protein
MIVWKVNLWYLAAKGTFIVFPAAAYDAIHDKLHEYFQFIISHWLKLMDLVFTVCQSISTGKI